MALSDRRQITVGGKEVLPRGLCETFEPIDAPGNLAQTTLYSSVIYRGSHLLKDLIQVPLENRPEVCSSAHDILLIVEAGLVVNCVDIHPVEYRTLEYRMILL